MRPKSRPRTPAPGTVLGGLALIVAMTGVSVGAIPGAGSATITACYDKAPGLPAIGAEQGALRVIDAEAGQTCKAKENTLSWKDGSTLLGKTEKAADADKLDGRELRFDTAKVDFGRTAHLVRDGSFEVAVRSDLAPFCEISVIDSQAPITGLAWLGGQVVEPSPQGSGSGISVTVPRDDRFSVWVKRQNGRTYWGDIVVRQDGGDCRYAVIDAY